MDYIYIGKIVNTHALKGEVRILSDFEFKDKVFIVNNNLYVGEEKKLYKIESHRKHKNFNMIKFYDINSINEATNLKNQKVYMLKSDLKLDDKEYLDNDIIGMKAIFKDNFIGNISNINYYGINKVIEIGKILIPFNNNFIEKVDIINNKIIFKNIEGLIK